MSDILISALHANGILHNNAASNVANANTRDYKSLRTILTNDAGGNVSAVTERSTTEGVLTDDGHFTSNVDLPQEFTDMILAQRGFEAMLGAIRTREEIMSDLMKVLTDKIG
ncbi:MAG TPA: flagellar basal body rod C-terminal domain-containing protein [Deltaproteobacteria bacterium]|jgi:flagellar hook protein FlgE|nr:flagellar basal body rod C-terminal domain-containing protein [Deltaproteobacteria bacterium]HQI02255.1 flagellar basal body rod C-terminal domain-containing protein [Deltaproteobacteria bacterium]